MSNIGSIFFQLIADASGLTAQVTSEGLKAGDSFAAAFTGRFKGQTAGLLETALGAGLAVASKGMLELDAAGRQYQATVGATDAEMRQAEADANQFFKTSTEGYDTILGTLGKLQSTFGLTQDQANALTKDYLEFAKASGQDSVAGVEGLSNAMKAWDVPAEDSQHLMDLLVASHQQYNLNIAESTDDLTRMTPVLQALGLTLNDGIGLLDAFAKKGLDAATAQRGLQQAILSLPKHDLTMQGFLDNLSAITDGEQRAAYAATIFGGKAGAALADTLQPGQTSLQDLVTALGDVDGRTQQAAADIDKSLGNQVVLALHNLQATAIEVLGPAGPILTGVAGAAQLAIGFRALGVPLPSLTANLRSAGSASTAAALAAKAAGQSEEYFATAVKGATLASGEAAPEIQMLGTAQTAAVTSAESGASRITKAFATLGPALAIGLGAIVVSVFSEMRAEFDQQIQDFDQSIADAVKSASISGLLAQYKAIQAEIQSRAGTIDIFGDTGKLQDEANKIGAALQAMGVKFVQGDAAAGDAVVELNGKVVTLQQAASGFLDPGVSSAQRFTNILMGMAPIADSVGGHFNGFKNGVDQIGPSFDRMDAAWAQAKTNLTDWTPPPWQDDIGAAVTAALADITRFSADAQAVGADAGDKTTIAVGQGILNERTNVDQAIDTLTTDIKNQLNASEEYARLSGLLHGKNLAEAMHSADPVVRAQAIDTRDQIQTRMDELTGQAKADGLKAAYELAAGLAQGKGALITIAAGIGKDTKTALASGVANVNLGDTNSYLATLKAAWLAAQSAADKATTTLSADAKNYDGAVRVLNTDVAALNKTSQAGAAKTSQAQKDLATTLKNDLTSAADAAKTKVLALLQAEHDAAVTAATTLHTATLQTIADDKNAAYALAERTANDAKLNLELQKQALFAGVNQEQTEFAAHQAQEQLDSLQASLDQAQQALAANTDPTQYASLSQQVSAATQALADFNTQQKISADQAAAQKASDALDAANQTIDPLTHAPTTVIDLTEQQAKAVADAQAAKDTVTADKALADAKTLADTLLKQQTTDFNASETLLLKQLEQTKGDHAKTIADIKALYAAFDAKGVGAKIGSELADGLNSEIAAVEKAAAALAAAITKYVHVGSPAEAGPLHDNPPDVMGQTIGTEIGTGVGVGLDKSLPNMTDVISAFVSQGLAAGQSALRDIPGKTGNPMAGAPSTSSAAVTPASLPASPGGHYENPSPGVWTWVPDGPQYTTAQQDALNGVFYDATGSIGTGNGYGTLNYKPDFGYATAPDNGGLSGRVVGAEGPSTGPGVTNITVNNPKPEPASRSTDKALRTVAAGAYR